MGEICANISRLPSHTLFIHQSKRIQFNTGALVDWTVQLGPPLSSSGISRRHPFGGIYVTYACVGGISPPIQFSLCLTKKFHIFQISCTKLLPFSVCNAPGPTGHIIRVVLRYCQSHFSFYHDKNIF